MDYPKFIVSNQLEESISTQRVNYGTANGNKKLIIMLDKYTDNKNSLSALFQT